jgi:hypothetical protein
MPKFMVDLDEAHREKLETHRVRLGLRSHAETVRALIDGAPKSVVRPGMEATYDRLAKSISAPMNVDDKISGSLTGTIVTVGPVKSKPGERLKKK